MTSNSTKQQIKVTLLHYAGLFSHIHLMLEKKDDHGITRCYKINRWETPTKYWFSSSGVEAEMNEASSRYSFYIVANAEEIVSSWRRYYEATAKSANIVRNNCAVAVEWFLEEFAEIPCSRFCSAPSVNHVALGLFWWPSFIPAPITLPGRVMSYACHYVEARKDASILVKQSKALKIAGVLVSMAFLGLSIAAMVFTGGLAALPILSHCVVAMHGAAFAGAVAATMLSVYSLFKSFNTLSAHRIAESYLNNHVTEVDLRVVS